jgi:hypothetical protein
MTIKPIIMTPGVALFCGPAVPLTAVPTHYERIAARNWTSSKRQYGMSRLGWIGERVGICQMK